VLFLNNLVTPNAIPIDNNPIASGITELGRAISPKDAELDALSQADDISGV